MKIIGLQLDSVWENKAASHGRALSLLDKAKPPAGALVVLPEMFATGFSMNVAEIYDESRETQDFLSRGGGAQHLFDGRRGYEGRGDRARAQRSRRLFAGR